MHCPDCGQQQISDEIRFCSRCGFPLAAVSHVIANRGVLPELVEQEAKKTIFSRKAGIFVGIAWILFFVLVVTTLLEILNAPGELTSLAAVFGIFSGVMMIVGSAFFLKSDREHFHRVDGRRQSELSASRFSALPPQQTMPVQNYIPAAGKNRWDTNDLVQPSVTDNTTKLLNND